ncbi:putative aquaporin NIP7-1 [Morella rubra]|uniref:Putative aquaporin NIP7-1 n=1 Tax=Morella rubra TaxID=262757 RepID=A0A6A1VN43_9ROSI|nr:putative aquaporin NIP7-1 [Morella rubra]
MKSLFEEPPPVVPNKSSTSIRPKDDREMGSNDMSESVDALNESAFKCFPQGMYLNLGRVVLAEMVGTFILIFAVCGIIACTQLMRGGIGLLEYAATAGLTVAVVIFSVGPISSAHVNPAITIAFAAFGHFPWSKVPIYIIAQTLGSVLATYIGQSVYGVQSEIMTTRPLHSCSSAFWVELIATFIIMFLVASLTHHNQSVRLWILQPIGQLSGFVVGIAIGLAVLITGPVSGGSMNPARSLGPAIISGKFKDVWIYVTAPTIGAVAGALLDYVLHLQPRSRSPTSQTSIIGRGR